MSVSEPVSSLPRRPARAGLYGGLVSSKQPTPVREPGEARGAPPKKPLSLRIVLGDAADLVKAHKARLALGLGLMSINRLCGLVLPGTTKDLLDDVIGKGHREMLTLLILAAGAAKKRRKAKRLKA